MITAYAHGKNVVMQTVEGQVLKDRAYEIALKPKYDRCQSFLIRKKDQE